MLLDLSAFEQLLLELTNARRAAAGVAPLAWNARLADAARDHLSALSAERRFSHAGADGSTPAVRMRRAGFVLTGAWAGAENLAWKAVDADVLRGSTVEALDAALFASPTHRHNLLDARFREAGAALVVGSNPETPAALMAAETFARSGDAVFLTGAAWTDADGDDRYDVGEGFGGVTIVTRPARGGPRVAAAARAGGGYDLPLRPGDWSVQALDGRGRTLATTIVRLGGDNIKLDLVGPPVGPPATLADVAAIRAGLSFRLRAPAPADPPANSPNGS